MQNDARESRGEAMRAFFQFASISIIERLNDRDIMRILDLTAQRSFDLGFPPACIYSNYLIYNKDTFMARR
jgi:hypothetical protein